MGRSHKKSIHKKSKSKPQSSVEYSDECDECNGMQGNVFEIQTSDVMGRFITSTKKILPGEVILSELPIVVGPCADCDAQCIGCYKNLDNGKSSFVRCECGWPICSNTCPGLYAPLGHTHTECDVLKDSESAKDLNTADLSQVGLHLQAIAPLRCLLLKNNDTKSFEIIMKMEHHNDIRKNITQIWNANQINVVDRIRSSWGLTEYSEIEIHTVCGVLEVNSFEIGRRNKVRGLYPTAFLISHDCVPNTNHVDDENYKLTIRASKEIHSGQAITLNYAPTMQSTLKRREYILNNKFFECRCERCSDPTELGSYFSALICPKCQTGLILCDKPLCFESSWSCRNFPKRCVGYKMTARSMELLLNRISQEVEKLDCNDIEGMEAFLDRYKNVLHQTHYLNFGVKVSLSQLYGKIDGFLIHELDDNALERKIYLCKEVLRTFDVIEPGYTRIRGVTQYEIHAPMMIQLTRKLTKKSAISKSEMKTKLKEIVKYLSEAKLILEQEPIESPEGQMGTAAAQALIQIKDWEKIVGRF
nr:unnamed protein product [Callosobruchus analis]